jgi:hypothetical protein
VTETNCAYRKCRHVAVMHTEGAGSCTWPHCQCRQFVDPARIAASIARHPAGKR